MPNLSLSSLSSLLSPLNNNDDDDDDKNFSKADNIQKLNGMGSCHTMGPEYVYHPAISISAQWSCTTP